jgi:hypothetical protein
LCADCIGWWLLGALEDDSLTPRRVFTLQEFISGAVRSDTGEPADDGHTP